jgi:hypothetical protein
MSWLSDRIVRHKYKMEDGSIRIVELPASEDAEQELTFSDDQKVGSYAGFEPEEIRQTNIVEYDQHGRKAVRIKDKNGKVTHMSKTKLNYIKTGRVENKYTKSYEEQLMKQKMDFMLRGEARKSKGTISKAPLEDMVKNLPDGEYVSDGTNVMAAPKTQQK